MLLLITSFLAGALTVLAPCVLPLLPVIIGSVATDHNKRNPFVITASLAVAIVIFTLMLKFSSLFINVPQTVWSFISGGIITVFGLITLFPGLWEKLSNTPALGARSERLLSVSAKKQNWRGDVLIGAALGPVFSSCSPTYFIILATVLPRSFTAGTIYLMAYALGLSAVLLLVSLLGQRFIRRVRFAANPTGWFKRTMGILFIFVGAAILVGVDKKFQTFLVNKGIYRTSNIEERLLNKITAKKDAAMAPDIKQLQNKIRYPLYKEISKPSGFVNTKSVTIGELVGKKVILVDFMTYSCINCIRTFPYLNDWYNKYKDSGLEIIGIHTPEFAFEHKLENVQAAMRQYGIEFPVVLDNNYATWRAYENNYWPRKYLIDINGNIVYDHIGEGGYDETEKKIQELLLQAGRQPTSTIVSRNEETPRERISPETYLGADRAEYYYPDQSLTLGTYTFKPPEISELPRNSFAFVGKWQVLGEKSIASIGSSLIYHFKASKVFLVLSPKDKTATGKIKVYVDGEIINDAIAGVDVQSGVVTVDSDRLYNLVNINGKAEDHTLKLEFETSGIEVFAFTFG